MEALDCLSEGSHNLISVSKTDHWLRGGEQQWGQGQGRKPKYSVGTTGHVRRSTSEITPVTFVIDLKYTAVDIFRVDF